MLTRSRRSGKAQSPIEIATQQAEGAPDTQTTLNRKAFDIVSDELDNDFSGKAVSRFDEHQVVVDTVDAYLDWSGVTYRLLNFKFHTP